MPRHLVTRREFLRALQPSNWRWSAIEDARVEHLAMRGMPGCGVCGSRSLALPTFTVTAVSLMRGFAP
jgi:hypothetical protein